MAIKQLHSNATAETKLSELRLKVAIAIASPPQDPKGMTKEGMKKDHVAISYYRTTRINAK
ncbi:hypothetical protein ACMA1I_00105 [Pontibacter sp. 13R65]